MANTIAEVLPWPVVKLFNFWACCTFVCYSGFSYMMYEIGPTLQLWSAWYYAPQIVSAIVIVVCLVLPKKKKERKVTQSSEGKIETKKDQ